MQAKAQILPLSSPNMNGVCMEYSEVFEKLFSIVAIVGLLGIFFFLQKAGIVSGG